MLATSRPLRALVALLLALPCLSISLRAMPPGDDPASSSAQPEDEPPAASGSLPGTDALTLGGDLASRLVEGVDRFLLSELERSVAERASRWSRATSSPEAYERSVAPQRARLRKILGAGDVRPPDGELELVTTLAADSVLGHGDGFTAHRVRWRAFGDVHAEGILLVPYVKRGDPAAPPAATASPPRRTYPVDVIALPDADVSPEALSGLGEGVAPEEQYARRLAESGCRVIVPALISRARGVALTDRHPHQLASRELLYRSAFELGRHLIGYEVEEVMALVDILERESGRAGNDAEPRKVAVAGWGEGGLLALYAAALDTRIDCALVSGAFSSLLDTWQEPIDRNVFGLLETFGGAELLSLVAPRPVVIEAARAPAFELPPGTGGAPARLVTPSVAEVRAEVERSRGLTRGLEPEPRIDLVESGPDGAGPPGTTGALDALLAASGAGPSRPLSSLAPAFASTQRLEDPAARERRLAEAIDRHSQELLVESPYVRAEFLKRLDTSSPEAYEKTSEEYRRIFRDEVIGRFDRELLPARPRSRVFLEGDSWTAHEVVLDVFDDVLAYGLLLVPKDLEPGERRPVVVCQHGLEGRPQHVIGEEGSNYYSAFAAKLAERGFVTFAPQNLYIFTDRFRTLQRKANLLGKTLFSVIVPQHEQIVRWLSSLDFVDPGRIGFYGLSYGGKSAMRIPALVKGYCLSICSADFNEWVWKNASTRSPYSYVWTGEYEIFEFDLGSTFNYAEMAALIAPRPFMVERGHFDGVAPDETVAYEFAKVRHLYEAKLKLPGRARIEWFVGPHKINGVGTFHFLHEHLRWPEPGEGDRKVGDARPSRPAGPSTQTSAEAGPAAPSATPTYDPTSRYRKIELLGWTVLANQALVDGHREEWEAARRLLEAKLYDITRIVPSQALQALRSVPIWMEVQDRQFPCACFHPSREWLSENGYNPEKAGAVELSNVKSFLRWTLDQPFMVLHELAHGYYFRALSDEQRARVKEAFEVATKGGRYDAVQHFSGAEKRAYALTDPMEYFAELSEAYFGTNDFYPFVRSELERHDQEGYEVLKELWGEWPR